MSDIKSAIRIALHPGQQLRTVAHNEPFKVGAVSDESLILLVGKKLNQTVIRWEQLEVALDELPHRKWLVVGGEFKTEGDPQTLDGALKKHVIKRSIASYVAPVLVEASLAEVDGGRPLRIKLTLGSNPSGPKDS